MVGEKEVEDHIEDDSSDNDIENILEMNAEDFKVSKKHQ